MLGDWPPMVPEPTEKLDPHANVQSSENWQRYRRDTLMGEISRPFTPHRQGRQRWPIGQAKITGQTVELPASIRCASRDV